MTGNGEGHHLELRGDMMNEFNAAHFGLPNHDVSDRGSGFGQISNLAGDPWLMQFALKFYFEPAEATKLPGRARVASRLARALLF